jgi:hypothetical protein
MIHTPSNQRIAREVVREGDYKRKTVIRMTE